MKKVIYVLVIPLITSFILYACDFGTTNGGYITEFQIDSLKLKIGTIESPYSNYYMVEPLDSTKYNDTLSYEIGFEISIAKTTYITSNQIQGFGLINTAMADPIPPSSKSNPALISIYSDEVIYANNQTFEAGESISTLFEGHYDWGDWKSVIQTTEDINNWYNYSPIILRLIEAPDSTINQTFTFKVTMDDGAIFEMTSPKLIIE